MKKLENVKATSVFLFLIICFLVLAGCVKVEHEVTVAGGIEVTAYLTEQDLLWLDVWKETRSGQAALKTMPEAVQGLLYGYIIHPQDTYCPDNSVCPMEFYE